MIAMRWSALLLAWLLGFGAAHGSADEWPPLPARNDTVSIPAQEWPRAPGPREVTVYVQYPGGAIEGLRQSTGLMLSLHNWGGTGWRGAADPAVLTERLDVIAIGVDYLQSGPGSPEDPPYDFGYLQALDALRALWWMWQGLRDAEIPFDDRRIFATGGSGGGNVSLMANKLAPRTFTCVVDLCGMARLSDDIAFGLKQRSSLNARYSPDPESPYYLNPDAQAIRDPGYSVHAATMKTLGNTCRVISVHGVDDTSCPVEDKRGMIENLQAAGLDAVGHFITEDDVDGTAVQSTGHALGDRTAIVLRFAEALIHPDAPSALRRKEATDFEGRDSAVRYATESGVYVIDYRAGYPVGRFERTGDQPGSILE
jgi:hypothetical protein